MTNAKKVIFAGTRSAWQQSTHESLGGGKQVGKLTLPNRVEDLIMPRHLARAPRCETASPIAYYDVTVKRVVCSGDTQLVIASILLWKESAVNTKKIQYYSQGNKNIMKPSLIRGRGREACEETNNCLCPVCNSRKPEKKHLKQFVTKLPRNPR